MKEGVFALLGALIGVAGGTVSTRLAARWENKRSYEALTRAAASDFLRPIVRLRQAYWKLDRQLGDAAFLRSEMDTSEQLARFEMDRLRLVIRSTEVQYFARRVIRHAHGLGLKVDNKPLRPDERCCSPGRLMEHFAYEFISGVRRETGVKPGIYKDPVKWNFENVEEGFEEPTLVAPSTPEDRNVCPIHGAVTWRTEPV